MTASDDDGGEGGPRDQHPRRATSMSNGAGGSATRLTDSGTAACTSTYDIPPSIAANSFLQRYSHKAALSANAAGSEINPRLCLMSVGL